MGPMKPWVRYALTFGAASALTTLALNWLAVPAGTGSSCNTSDSPLPSLAPLAFIGLMLATGFMTTRAGGTVGVASLAGLVAALVSSAGTLLAALITGASTDPCVPENAGLARFDVAMLLFIGAVAVSLLGLALGAGLGAIGGVFGRRDKRIAA